jgi:hypothetical protein
MLDNILHVVNISDMPQQLLESALSAVLDAGTGLPLLGQ